MTVARKRQKMVTNKIRGFTPRLANVRTLMIENRENRSVITQRGCTSDIKHGKEKKKKKKKHMYQNYFPNCIYVFVL